MAKTGGYLFLTGEKALDRKIKRMPFAIQGRILREALKAAMTPVRDEARAKFPKRTGRTAKRFRIKLGKPNLATGRRDARVGIFGKATGGKSRAFRTARAVEFGTDRQGADAPLRRALQSQQNQALRILQSQLRAGVIEAARTA